MSLFEQYIIIDWSAANRPKRGKDSIWIAVADHAADLPSIENFSTRHSAMERVTLMIEQAVTHGRKTFLGFDFAFGYPAGAAKIMTGKADWSTLWTMLSKMISDDDKNCSNRFRVGAALNKAHFPPGQHPFWGHPHQHNYTGLCPTKSSTMPEALKEKRLVELCRSSTKSVWQLAYSGSVGSQSLVGIPRLQALRKGRLSDYIAIWPFETNFSENLSKPVIIAEVYPSIFPVHPRPEEVKDAAQVRTLATNFAQMDKKGKFKAFLDQPGWMTEEQVHIVLHEEGWIVGINE